MDTSISSGIISSKLNDKIVAVPDVEDTMELGILQYDHENYRRKSDSLHMLKTHIQEYGFEAKNLDF